VAIGKLSNKQEISYRVNSLLISESKAEEKDTIVKVIVNLINQNN
jgi:hypothetical protein